MPFVSTKNLLLCQYGDLLTDVELVQLVASPKDKYSYKFVPLAGKN